MKRRWVLWTKTHIDRISYEGPWHEARRYWTERGAREAGRRLQNLATAQLGISVEIQVAKAVS